MTCLNLADKRPDVLAEREARIRALAERVAGDLGHRRVLAVIVQPKQRCGQGRPGKPVISDMLEWFPSAKEAAPVVGVNRTAIIHAIRCGWCCAGRTWRYATKEENRAAGRSSSSQLEEFQ